MWVARSSLSLTALGPPTLALGENLGPELVRGGGREALSGKGSGHRRRLISKPKSIHRVERVAWRGRDDLGWAWEWVEDNLDMRAATTVAKVVEKGRVAGLGASQSVSWCYGKAWESLGVVDGAFGLNGIKSSGMSLIFVTCSHVLHNFVPLTVKYHIPTHLF